MDIRYRFVSEGSSEVTSSLSAITAQMRAAAAAQREYRRTVNGGSSARTADPAKQAEREAARAAKRTEAESIRSARRAEAEKIRLAKQSEAEKTRIARMAEQQRTREANQERKGRERAERESAKALAAFYSRQAKQQHRDQLAQHRKTIREQERIDKIRQQRSGGFGMLAGGALVAGVAAGASVIRAGAGFAADQASQRVRADLDAKKLAAALSTGARGAGQKGVDPERLLAEARGTAKMVKGTTPEDVLRAQSKYVAMVGDLEGSRRYSKTFATAAKATGADISDIAATGAIFASKFGIKTEKEMQAAFAQMAMQGRKGSFEISDAASHYSDMGAAASRFGLEGSEGLKTLGGLSQLARMSTGNGAKASTSLQAMLRQIVAKGADEGNEGMAAHTGGKKVGKKWTGGVQVFTDDTHTRVRDIKDLLPDMIAGMGGNLGSAQKLMGEEGIAALSPMLEAFNKAANATGSKDDKVREAAGRKAVTDMLSEAINAGGSWQDITQDATTMTGADDSISSLDQALTERVGNALTPVVEALADNLDKVTPALESMADAVTSVVDATGVWVQYLESKFGKAFQDQSKTSRTPMLDLASADAEIKSLDKIKEQSGGLTIDQRRKRRKLETRRVELAQQLIGGDGADELTGTLLDAGIPLEGTPQYSAALGMVHGGGVGSALPNEDSRFDNTREVGKLMTGGSDFAGISNILTMGSGGFGALAGLSSLAGFATQSVAGDVESGEAAAAATKQSAGELTMAASELKAAAAAMKTSMHQAPPGAP